VIFSLNGHILMFILYLTN